VIRFRDAIRSRDFVLTAQLPLTPGSTAADIRHTVETLLPLVYAVQVGDNTSTVPHMSPLAAASIALQAGADPIMHLTCRDRNRIALQSDLLGAAAIGITSLILSRGVKLPANHKQRIKGVFDIGAQRLLATAQAIAANERLVAPPGFFLGANATVIDPPEDWSADGIDGKAGAGTKFVQTQPCLDVAVLEKYMVALVAKKALERISVIVQVPLLESTDMLDELRRARRPLLPGHGHLQRLEQAEDFRQEAETICIEVLQAVKTVPGVSGANILHRGDAAAVMRVANATSD
jgi:methylenetetrahydrofolate reductase (NADPH)